MVSALHSFSSVDGAHKTVILGDMLELGGEAIQEHTSILSLCDALDLSYSTIGPLFLEAGSKHGFIDVQSMLDANFMISLHDRIILLKGSRGIGLEKLVPFL